MKKRKVLILLLMIMLFVEGFYLTKNVNTVYAKERAIQKEENTEVILNDDEEKAYELINQYRELNGLQKLRYSGELQEVANIKAQDLQTAEVFSHDSEKYGKTFNIMKDKGISYKVAGENLAGNISSEKAVEAWINSKTHRENILDDEYNYTAISVVESEEYGKIFVQLFMKI